VIGDQEPPQRFEAHCKRCGAEVIFAETLRIFNRACPEGRGPKRREQWVVFNPNFSLHGCRYHTTKGVYV
jgi:hypothetical protein